MGFWSRLFGKKKPKVSRSSAAVARYARQRGISIHAVDLGSDSVIEDLLILGLLLSDDGEYYYDDPSYVVIPDSYVVIPDTYSGGVETTVAPEVIPELPPEPTPVVEPEPNYDRAPSYDSAPSYDPPSYSSGGSSGDSYDSGSRSRYDSGGGGYDSDEGYDGGGGDCGGGCD